MTRQTHQSTPRSSRLHSPSRTCSALLERAKHPCRSDQHLRPPYRASGNGARVSAGLGEAWNPASWNPATWNPTTWVANQQWTDPNVPVTTNVWDTQVNYNTWPGQQPTQDTQASLGQCQSSLRDSAELVQLGTYIPPDSCQALVVCAGSPRASSTAECTIATHVLEYMLSAQKKKGLTTESKATYLGYWNYHLHTLCGDGDGCETKYPSDLRYLRTRLDWSKKMDQTFDPDAKGQLSGILTEMDRYYEKRDAIAPESVIITKSHEFDGTLMDMCDKRIVLTSSRDSEEVFDSGLNLGWFDQPKEESRDTFNKYFELWRGWKSCWTSAAENDINSVLFDMDYTQLTTEGSFRAIVMQMTYEIAQLLNVQDADTNYIVEQVLQRDFQRELNPSLTTGGLPVKTPGTLGKGEAGKYKGPEHMFS